jgi:hypothetical protein
MVNRPNTVTTELDPPATNRGVKNTISALLDWISVTFKKGQKVSYPIELTNERAECKPLQGYNSACRYADGRIELWHTLRPDMGIHVIASGQTLRAMPVSPETYLKHVVQAGGKITRLDVAIDARNANLVPSEATRRIKLEQVTTKARKFPTWCDAKEAGYTQYIGKKSSTAYARIYDKAAEMGISEDYTRVEVSFNAERAMEAATLCLGGKAYLGLVRGFVDFHGWPEWEAVMCADVVRVEYERNISNTKRWLLSAATTSLAREVFLDQDHSFYFRFVETFKFFLEELEAQEVKRAV